MSNELALINFETPNNAVTNVQKAQSGTDTAESFKKKLENCEAMVIPMQALVVGDSEARADIGIQNIDGLIEGLSGDFCILEGFETPIYLPDVGVITESVLSEAMVQSMNLVNCADGNETGNTSELIAWMQKTTAGDNPVLTQDKILEKVGAYLDTASEIGENKLSEPVHQIYAEQMQENTEQDVKPLVSTLQGSTKDAKSIKQGAPAEVNAEQTKSDTPEKNNSAKSIDVKQQASIKTSVQVESGQILNAQSVDAGKTATASNVAFENTAEAHLTEQTQDTKENVMRIVQQVSTHSSEGRYDFDVELKPDYLGKVSIKLTMEGGNIRMQIKTDDMSVKGMFNDQTLALHSALEEKGITLTSIDVAYESQSALDNGHKQFDQEQSSRQQSNAYNVQTETVAIEAAEPYSYYVGNSSVEFLA